MKELKLKSSESSKMLVQNQEIDIIEMIMNKYNSSLTKKGGKKSPSVFS